MMDSVKLQPAQTFGRLGFGKTLAGRIRLGFFCALMLHAAVAYLSHVGLESARHAAIQMEERRVALETALSHDRDLVALQRDVLTFMYTGAPSIAETTCEEIVAFRESLGRVVESRQSPDVDLTIRQLEQALVDYEAGFDNVVVDRRERDRLLRESVRPFAIRFQSEANALVDASLDGPNAQAAFDVARWFTACYDQLDQYLESPSGTVAREFAQCHQRVSTALATLEQEEMRRELKGWFLDSNAVINRTRNYLHLVNVVLAGVALEFRTVSQELTERTRTDQQLIATALAAKQKRFATLSNAFGIFTVLVGLAAAARIGHSVSQPIQAMTETFNRLAKGERVEIEGTNRTDEIGQMARAAEVFAERNQQTQTLLRGATRQSLEQRKLNAELKLHVERLKQRNEDLDSFSYSASHDLKAPLRSIRLLASWIDEDEGNRLTEESVDYLDKLGSRVHRLETLLSGILEYARAGRDLDLAQRVSVRSVAEEVLDDLRAGTGAIMTVEGDEGNLYTPLVVLRKCLQNLVANSLDHHDRDDPSVTLRIEDTESCVRIKVIDDGPGIDPSQHERVFGIFQTGRRRDEHESSGIGLAIVERLTKSHDVRLSVESDGMRGCVMTLDWPRSKDAEPEARNSHILSSALARQSS